MTLRREREPDGGESTHERPRAHRGIVSRIFEVNVIAGPDRGKGVRIDESVLSRVLVGQSPACGLRLTDREASRRHLALEVVGPCLQVTDLGSTNGTRVNGVAVGNALLDGDERVVLGTTTLHVTRAPATNTFTLSPLTSFGRVVGASAEMRKLYPTCVRLAESDVPVIIEGETGTGKEALAEAIHENGARARGPFVVFDCTAVPPSLMESALFGHERGAFTGASELRRGVFEQADGGTLLIDEIGDLDVQLQMKLLRVIERSEIQRLGSNTWVRVDCRILAATRRDLDREIQRGRFRDDLFYRLAVARIELPPLRRRQGDISLLATHFWQQLAGSATKLEDAFLARLEDYAWPGNIRELHNTIARRRVFGDDIEIGLASKAVSTATAPGHPDTLERVLALELPLPETRQLVSDELERRYVERIVAKHGGNVTRAAEASGLALRYFKLLRARTASRSRK
jgi:DNA-binding NtrC family response regulator